MASGGARFTKGDPATLARMAKVREARAAKSALPTGESKPAPFIANVGKSVMTVEVNEFTGIRQDFPQTRFAGIDVIDDHRAVWPGDN